MSQEKFNEGTSVKWKWGEGWGSGKIEKCFTEKVSRSISGTEVTRNASEDEPACLIEQDDGDKVLKFHSEIQKDD